MPKKVIFTDNAPKAIGPYSQGIQCKVTEFVYLSGQVALDPQTMTIVSDDVGAQTEQSIRNLTAVLTAADLSLDNVVKTTVFLKDMNDFNKMNEVYGKHFVNNPPARSTIEVARLPKDAKVEIEAIAVRG